MRQQITPGGDMPAIHLSRHVVSLCRGTSFRNVQRHATSNGKAKAAWRPASRALTPHSKGFALSRRTLTVFSID
jgi:hypothetical protein